MGNTFAIGDIHGRHDLLRLAIEAIEYMADPKDGAATVVFLGDYIDRGPSSMQVLDTLMRGPTKDHIRYVCIQGNHEAMMVETLRTPLHPGWWYGNGGKATVESFGLDPIDFAFDYEGISAEYISWIESLPLFYEDAHRVYVHAFIDPTLPLSQQVPQRMQWDLWPAGADLTTQSGKHIVHGHEQDEFHPLLLKNRTNLDVGAFYTNRLVIGVFEDERPGGPVHLVEVGLDDTPEAVEEAA